jgi:hypothetical protein
MKDRHFQAVVVAGANFMFTERKRISALGDDLFRVRDNREGLIALADPSR